MTVKQWITKQDLRSFVAVSGWLTVLGIIVYLVVFKGALDQISEKELFPVIILITGEVIGYTIGRQGNAR